MANETVNDTVNSISNQSAEIAASYFQGLWETILPTLQIIGISIATVIIILIIFKILKFFREMSDHKRLIRVEKKLDSLIEKLNKKKKKR